MDSQTVDMRTQDTGGGGWVGGCTALWTTKQSHSFPISPQFNCLGLNKGKGNEKKNKKQNLIYWMLEVLMPWSAKLSF